ncbi:MAG: hypothetical protein QOE00_2274 [Ilumatobacteraceae bacterium]|jgi:hypothetical protein
MSEVSTPDPPLGGRRYNPNTPEGQIESAGMFARGLGARRIKVIFVAVLVAIVVVVLVGAIF